MREVDAILQEAVEHWKRREFIPAIEIYEKVLECHYEPDFNLFMGLGSCYAALDRYGLAIHFLRNAVDMVGIYPEPWVNLGSVLSYANRRKEALNCFSKALEIEPNNAETLANIAGWYINSGQPTKVVEYARRAVEIDPTLAVAHTHLAFGLLEQQRYDEAWEHYEWRWKLPEQINRRRPYKVKLWEGENVRRLAIHGEQGLGDEILFMSCFEAVRHKVGSVFIECAPKLVDLFRRSFSVPCYPDHASLIAEAGEPDAYIPMGSLPRVVGLPQGKPFLKPHMAHQHRGKPRVGLCWRGGTQKTNKFDRTIKLDDLSLILSLPSVQFVSLQYGDARIQAEAEKHNLEMAVKGDSIDACVEAIASCDLVISVCQTAVHLAGGMGKECWVLTPKKCAWRYSGKGTSMMPWYSSVKLYRQGSDEKWQPVIRRIAKDLQAYT